MPWRGTGPSMWRNSWLEASQKRQLDCFWKLVKTVRRLSDAFSFVLHAMQHAGVPYALSFNISHSTRTCRTFPWDSLIRFPSCKAKHPPNHNLRYARRFLVNCREATCLSYPSYSFFSPKMSHRLATPMKLFDIAHHACKCTLPCVQTTISNKVKCWVTKRYRVSRCRFRIKGSSSSSRGKQVKLDTLGSLGRHGGRVGWVEWVELGTVEKPEKKWEKPESCQSCSHACKICANAVDLSFSFQYFSKMSILWSSGPSARFCTLRAGTA